MNSVPFSIRGGVHEAFLDVEGILRLERQELVVEFRTKLRFARFFKSDPKEVRVPLSEVEEVSFQRRLCLGFLEVRTRRLGAFSGLPHSEGGRLRILCSRAHWGAARELASSVSLSLVTEDLRAMVESNAPPVRTAPGSPAPQADPEQRSERRPLGAD